MSFTLSFNGSTVNIIVYTTGLSTAGPSTTTSVDVDDQIDDSGLLSPRSRQEWRDHQLACQLARGEDRTSALKDRHQKERLYPLIDGVRRRTPEKTIDQYFTVSIRIQFYYHLFLFSVVKPPLLLLTPPPLKPRPLPPPPLLPPPLPPPPLPSRLPSELGYPIRYP